MTYSNWLDDMTELEKEKCCECQTGGDAVNQLHKSLWHKNGNLICDECRDKFIDSENDFDPEIKLADYIHERELIAIENINN